MVIHIFQGHPVYTKCIYSTFQFSSKRERSTQNNSTISSIFFSSNHRVFGISRTLDSKSSAIARKFNLKLFLRLMFLIISSGIKSSFQLVSPVFFQRARLKRKMTDDAEIGFTNFGWTQFSQSQFLNGRVSSELLTIYEIDIYISQYLRYSQ